MNEEIGKEGSAKVEGNEPAKKSIEGAREAAKESGAGNEAREESRKDGDPCAETKDRLLRLAAEFENYKKRVMKEAVSARELAKADLARSLLPIIDEFYFAVLASGESQDKNFSKGVEMLYSNFIDAMKKEGLERVKADGRYDPYLHEIMMTKESERKPGTILEVVKEGYTFNGILLRPAAIVVAAEKAAPQEDAKGPEKKEG